MAPLALLAPLGAATAAEEGKKVILAMLVTGLIFVAVIVRPTAAEEGKKVITAMLVVGLISSCALGQLTHWLRHRNH